MRTYIASEEEQEYLKQYHIEDYERPSVAADIVVFSMLAEGERKSIRKLQQQELKVLLVKRNSYPYKDCWALPGGFCVSDEDVYETARRELVEETGVKDVYLEAVDVYGERGRDPRGWIISNTFMAIINGAEYRLHAGTDAWEAKWFTIDFKDAGVSVKDGVQNKAYELSLKAEDICLHATIQEAKTFQGCHACVKYELEESEGLAFDHAKIILNTVLKLQRKAENDITLLFDLLPEQFTIAQAQNAYECLLHRSVLGPNFRRKINLLVMETEDMIEGEGFRPAKLYCRNVEALL